MKKESISLIEKRLFSGEADESYLKELESDSRKGVRLLLERWERKQRAEKSMREKFRVMTEFESRLRNEGFRQIAGIDEAGRGPLAGPVVAASVILPEGFYLPGLDDSKKLSSKKRAAYFEAIMEGADAVGIGVIHAEEIDRINILQAAKKAMLHAVVNMVQTPDYLLVDAVKLDTPYPSEALIKGDARSISIAAASIIAKETRDRMMEELHQAYPQYGFSANMGYGTAAHIEALRTYGPSPCHRLTFEPVKTIAGK